MTNPNPDRRTGIQADQLQDHTLTPYELYAENSVNDFEEQVIVTINPDNKQFVYKDAVDKSLSQKHHYNENEGETATTSEDLIEKVNLTFTPEKEGLYIIEWYLELNSSNIQRNITVEIDLNNITLLSGSLDLSSSNRAYPNGWSSKTGFKRINLLSEENIIRIMFSKSENPVYTVYMRNARILARRVS